MTKSAYDLGYNFSEEMYLNSKKNKENKIEDLDGLVKNWLKIIGRVSLYVIFEDQEFKRSFYQGGVAFQDDVTRKRIDSGDFDDAVTKRAESLGFTLSLPKKED